MPINVFMESGEHAGHVWAHNATQVKKLAIMHTMLLHAKAHISAKYSQIRKINVSIESGEYDRPVWVHNVTHVLAHKSARLQR